MSDVGLDIDGFDNFGPDDVDLDFGDCVFADLGFEGYGVGNLDFGDWAVDNLGFGDLGFDKLGRDDLGSGPPGFDRRRRGAPVRALHSRRRTRVRGLPLSRFHRVPLRGPAR